MLRVLDNEKKIAPVGFNIGIRACLASGADAILLVSGHSRLHSGFLVEAQRVLDAEGACVVGCVLDYPPAASRFERAAQAFVESRLGRRMRSYSRLKGVAKTEIATFPTIHRQVFDRIGLFDETMVRNQDIEFTARARDAGFGVFTSPDLKCRYSPPVTFSHLLRQMYGNGLWVGRRVGAHGARHLAPALFFGSLLAAAALALAVGGSWTIVFSALAGLYLAGIALETATWCRRIGLGAAWLFLSFLGGHAAYALGTFRGLLSPGPAPVHEIRLLSK